MIGTLEVVQKRACGKGTKAAADYIQQELETPFPNAARCPNLMIKLGCPGMSGSTAPLFIPQFEDFTITVVHHLYKVGSAEKVVRNHPLGAQS